MWVNLGDGDHILTAFSWCVERSGIGASPRDRPGKSRLPECIIPAGEGAGKAAAESATND